MTTSLLSTTRLQPADGIHPTGTPLPAEAATIHPGAGAAAKSPPAPPAALAAEVLHIEPWLDPVVDKIGHDPRSAYVELFWLPVLGPSTIWLLRRFALYLENAAGGVDCAVDDLARRLGIGERSGPNGPFGRTLKRCVDFQMAQWRGETLAVRLHLPPLARRHLRRLPGSLQSEHEEVVAVRRRHPAGKYAPRDCERP